MIRVVRTLCVFLGLFLPSVAPAAVSAQVLGVGPLVLAPTQLSAVEIEGRNNTLARALFDEGLRFVDSENWQQAQDRFGRVLELRYSAVAAYNLGLAQARLGHGVVAAAALRRLLADPGLDPKVRDRTNALLHDIESRFAWLNVRVFGDCKHCAVFLNKDEWPWAVVGVSVPVDPGKYTLQLRRASQVLSEQHVQLAPTVRLEASLFANRDARGATAPAGALQAPVAPATAAPKPAAHSSLLSSGWFWGTLGVLAVGATTAIILEVQ
jgi:hypothetical protein